MTKEIVKKNQSSIQVLKTLNALLEDNYTMQELIQKLNENEKEPVFNNSVICKYINTCRYCGIDIIKVHNKYYVTSMPFGMDVSNKDLDLFIMLQEAVKKTFSSRALKAFDKLLSKISKYSNKKIIRVEKKTVSATFEMFEKAILEKRKIILMFKAKSVLECIPLDITEEKDKKYFKVLVDDKEKMILVDRIIGLEALDVKIKPNFGDRTIIYKLTGGLAKRYSLRENEAIIANNLPESIVISNFGEPEDVLLSRLMRYDKDCEIISPVDYRNNIIEMIDKTLTNYGE